MKSLPLSGKCESSVVSAPSTVLKKTSWAPKEKMKQEISTVVAEILGRIPFPVSMRTDIESNRSDASLLLTCQKEFFCGFGTVTFSPFLYTQVAKFVLATASGGVLVLQISVVWKVSHVI